MVSTLSSIIDSTDPREVREIIKTIADPLGTFYRFSMAHSVLHPGQSH